MFDTVMQRPVRKLKHACFALVLVGILFYFGVFTHFLETDFESNFHYPYDGDIGWFVNDLRMNKTPVVVPINNYNFQFHKPCEDKCRNVNGLRLVYLVKSAPDHFEQRVVIRTTWGYEHRFSDVEIRTVFLLGTTKDKNINKFITEESRKFKDVVQANFTDSYYNNTLKTMMGLTWAVRYCPTAKFYMFADDDYYISTKNVLRFIKHPSNYPQYLKHANALNPFVKKRSLSEIDYELDDYVRLYAGYRFKSSPLRHRSSKWYVSLEEYPYDTWPPYITAGAYILSREALLDMYYASFYTQHFRFDDIYLAFLAYKSKIEPFHCDEFRFNRQDYDPNGYKFLIASHGYSDAKELLHEWSQQYAFGNA